MPRKRSSNPTEAELSILLVLWSAGPATVREVKNTLSEAQPVGYTTVLKTMQIMTSKALVTRDETQHAHIYQAAFPQEQTQRQMVSELLDRAFSGSATRLVMQALSEKPASRKELSQIRELLDQLEQNSTLDT